MFLVFWMMFFANLSVFWRGVVKRFFFLVGRSGYILVGLGGF